ncbi:MAG: hypothetical protein KKF44_05430 [Nanoarchaeota archaeon]|nr:hypothetical protein [Nanoarchaeota archaeon]
MTNFKINNRQVSINKELTELDMFVLDLIDTIERIGKYCIISGYVSIFFGRARATEDIDLFLEKITFENFKKLYADIIIKGYEFTEEDPERLYYEYLSKAVPINIWKKDFPLLRLEVKFALKLSQKIVLNKPLVINLNEKYILMFSGIEEQIAYKRYIAKSQKDQEDARHLEIVFQEIDLEKIANFKRLFLEDL